MVLLGRRVLSGASLDDGSRLRVWGVQRGMPATLWIRETYGRKPYVWIPADLRRRLGLVPVQLAANTGTPEENSVVVWFTRYDRRRDGYRWRLFSRVEVVDASGRVIGEAAQSPFTAAELKGGVLWVRHPPADGAGFRLRLFGGNPVRWLGEIPVPAASASAASSRR